ncbi:MAG: preprotein translocase subunit SecG [Alphaproteobacteria bacterium]|nr:preprotein translocase subunit SecG [Alphaproteobacteria bacterium]
MSSVLLVLQLIVAIFLVAVILMQRSNGGALSGLGGGDIGGLLSARSKGNILTRITAVLATLFFGLSLAISIYFSRMEVVQTSVVDNVAANAATQQQPASSEAPAANIPAEPAAPEEASEPEVPVAE